MHRDEQSGWQAGSYSFLTSAHTVIHRTAGPLPFLLLLLHHLPLSLSTLFSVSFLALFLPSLLFVAHSLSTLVPPLPPSLDSYSLAHPFSLPISLLSRGPCFLTCITHNYFHPSIICLLLFSHPTSFSLHYDNNPHYPAYTRFFATPFSHLPPLWAAEYSSPHTCSPSPSPPLSCPRAHPLLYHPNTRCPQSLGECVYLWSG